MAIVTIRPNGGDYTLYTVTGAANGQTALSDNTDASYIRRTSATAMDAFVADFGTTSIGATQRVKSVTSRLRIQRPTGGGQYTLYLRTTNPSNGVVEAFYAYPTSGNSGGIVTETYAEQNVAFYSEFSQTMIDNLSLRVVDMTTISADRSYFYEAYLDVDVRNQPTVAVTAPTGTVTATSRPSVQWTFTDADGDPQVSYEVKVFSAAQYTAGTFDPATTTPLWTSGEVSDSATRAVQIAQSLSNGTYRAYVRCSKSMGFSLPAFYSAWAFSGFIVACPTPVVPAIAVSFDSVKNRVYITLTGAAPTGFDRQTYEVQRKVNSTWVAVRDASLIVPDVAGFAELWDYEATRASLNYYRVRVTGYVSGDPRTSGWREGYIDLPGTSGNYLSTADAASLDITGDIDIALNITPADWTPAAADTLLAKWNTTGNQRSYRLDLATSGALVLYWSADGSTELSATSTANLSTQPNNQSLWVRATLDVNNGAAGRTVNFYYALHSDTEPTSTDWTALGSPVTTAGVTSIFNSTAVLTVGATANDANLFDGAVSYVMVRNGIGGTGALQIIAAALTDPTVNQFTAQTGQAINRNGTVAIVPANLTVPNDGLWWFKPVTAPGISRGGIRVQHGLDQQLDEAVGIFYPIGRGEPVVISSGLRGYSGSYEIVTLTQLEWSQLKVILEHVGILYVEDPLGGSTYIRLVGRNVRLVGTSANPTRQITVSYVTTTSEQ